MISISFILASCHAKLGWSLACHFFFFHPAVNNSVQRLKSSCTSFYLCYREEVRKLTEVVELLWHRASTSEVSWLSSEHCRVGDTRKRVTQCLGDKQTNPNSSVTHLTHLRWLSWGIYSLFSSVLHRVLPSMPSVNILLCVQLQNFSLVGTWRMLFLIPSNYLLKCTRFFSSPAADILKPIPLQRISFSP